ncbi:MAG: hypothetical protein HRU25_14130 [Psychrobium sp.]|nr:hypothetical protein [Psychrobium sp.]
MLGASRLSLIALLSKESLTLLAGSVFIAFPLAFYFINDWLNNFNDRITQSVFVYALVALLVSLVTWLTVAVIAYRTASISPSHSLHCD